MQFHTGLEDADALWNLAIRTREKGYAGWLARNPNPTRQAEEQAYMKYLQGKHSEALNEYNYYAIKDKEYYVTIGGKRGKLTGEQVITRINNELSKTFEGMHKFIRGEPGALDDYIIGY